MRSNRLAYLLAFSAIAALGGCGGGDSGSGSSAAVGNAASSPTPTPSQTASLLPPAPFGLTASQNFAVLGWMRPKDGEVLPVTSPDLSFSWQATAKTYEARLPGYEAAQLFYTFPGNNLLAFSLKTATGQVLDRAMTVNDGRRFSGRAGWHKREGESYPAGEFAFGIATPAGAVPSGSARTFFLASGFEYPGRSSAIDGELVFDPQNGKLSGYFDIAYVDAWGPYEPVRYQVTSTTYVPGSTNFSATIVIPDAPSPGTIEGQFTGPNAEEVILRWSAPVREPYNGKWELQTGVRLGTTL